MLKRRKEMAKGAAASRPQSSTAKAKTFRLRKLATAVAGFSVLLLGLALLAVPVPGTSMVVIPLGLAILAREFPLARRLRDWLTGAVKRTWATVRSLFGGRPLIPAADPRP